MCKKLKIVAFAAILLGTVSIIKADRLGDAIAQYNRLTNRTAKNALAVEIKDLGGEIVRGQAQRKQGGSGMFGGGGGQGSDDIFSGGGGRGGGQQGGQGTGDLFGSDIPRRGGGQQGGRLANYEAVNAEFKNAQTAAYQLGQAAKSAGLGVNGSTNLSSLDAAMIAGFDGRNYTAVNLDTGM